MFRVSVMYPYTEGARFDMDYYRNQHMALVTRLMAPHGLIKTGVDQGITGGGGNPPPYIAVGHLYFESAAAWENCNAAIGSGARDDLPNFTEIIPVRQGSTILDE